MSVHTALVLLGLAGLVAGVVACSVNWARSKEPTSRPSARRWFWAATLLGLLLGGATFPLVYWTGYPVRTPDGTGRIVGIPFLVAYFDSRGFDYVGLLSVPAALGNALFWFLVPHLALRGAFALRRERPRRPDPPGRNTE